MQCLNCGNEFKAKRSTQRFCSRECQLKGVAQGIVAQDNVAQEDIIAQEIAQEKPANYGQPGCECMHCAGNSKSGNKLTINHSEWKPIDKLGNNEVNRVSLPGDVDYSGVTAV